MEVKCFIDKLDKGVLTTTFSEGKNVSRRAFVEPKEAAADILQQLTDRITALKTDEAFELKIILEPIDRTNKKKNESK